MARFRGSLVVDASPEAAFDYLSDFSNVERWDPSVVEAKRLDPGPLRAGSRFSVALGFLGRSLELEYRITKFEGPHRVVLQADVEGFRSVDTITIEPARAQRTRITYDARIHLIGMRVLLDGPLQVAFAFVGRSALEGLRQAFSEEALLPPVAKVAH